MELSRERRNGGRLLGVVIESKDRKSRTGLQALSMLTRDTFRSRGFDVSRWPPDARTVLAGVGAKGRFVRTDHYGQEHVFALVDCGEFDLLFAVSSRREVNVGVVRSGNLATNVLLEVLSTPDPVQPGRPWYGEVGAEDLNRLWRNDVGAAHVQAHAREWDLVLWSGRDRLDYLMSGTSLMGLVKGNQAAEQATALVVNGSKHKAVAHELGMLKYPDGQTHPLVKVHPVTRQIEGHNQEVVEAYRDALRLLRAGASWEETAVAVGGRIPAPQAQQEPDDDHDGGRVRTRAGRNAERVARGAAALPLRFLPDGSPNPEYRPETILDLNRPADRLCSLLVGGVSVPTGDLQSIRSRIDTDLNGIAPEDAFLEFYGTGIYRRLVKDHTLSNSSVNRYRWVAFDLGPTADGNFVLTTADIEFLRSCRTGRRGTGSWGNNPLTGVFRVEQTTPLYTRSGWLDPAAGAFRVRSASDGTTRGLRIWFEPPGAPPHSAGCCAVGWLPNTVIGPALARALVQALTNCAGLAEFRFDLPTLHEDPTGAARQAVTDLERRHETTAVRLADPELSELTIAVLKRELASIELLITDAHSHLAEVEAGFLAATEQTHDDVYDITDLASLAAVLEAAVPVPPSVAARAARLLRAVLHDPRLILHPATATVRLEATLMLSNDRGMLTVPLRAVVPNQSSDPWVAGVAGMWWERRTVSFAKLMKEKGLATNPGTATRWRERVACRLLAEASERGRSLRGPNLAALLVRCDDADMLAEIRTAIDGGGASEALSALLFEGHDVVVGQRWAAVSAGLAKSRSRNR